MCILDQYYRGELDNAVIKVIDVLIEEWPMMWCETKDEDKERLILSICKIMKEVREDGKIPIRARLPKYR